MARWGRVAVSWWAAALVGSCVYDSASLDADPFDGLTVLPPRDAGSPPEPAPDAGRASDASTPTSPLVDAATPDAGASDASTPPRAEPDAGGTTRPDAGSVTRDAGFSTDAGAPTTPVEPGSTDPGSYSCADLTYESFGRAFMKRYCNDCHSVQKPTLLTLETIALNKDVVRQTTVTTQRMPLKSGAVPTLAQRVQLGVWLDCGPY